MKTCENCLYCKLDWYERYKLFKGKTRFVRFLKHIWICIKCSWSSNKKYFESVSVKYYRMGGEK